MSSFILKKTEEMGEEGETGETGEKEKTVKK